MCKRKYPLQWLDLMLFDDPTKNKSYENGMSQKGILTQLEEQFSAIRARIQGELFRAKKSRKRSEHLVRYYYNSLTYYMNLLYEKQQNKEEPKNAVNDISNLLIARIDTLLSFIEKQYENYLGEDQKVPKYYLNRTKEHMQETIQRLRLRAKKLKCPHANQVCKIVLNAMERFTKTSKHHYKVTYRCLNYRSELLRKLQAIEIWETDEKSGKFPLDTFLILINFNSKTYVNYLTSCVSERIKSHENPILCLQGFYKEFKQLHTNTAVSFNPKYQNIVPLIDNWFQNEMHYYHNIVPNNEPVKNGNVSIEKKVFNRTKKVMCELSSDQIALFLRAADDSRVLLAKSMTEVFRSIVPHLSTPHKTDLSYEAVRIKAYSPEQSDKDAVLQVLHNMIKKITDY